MESYTYRNLPVTESGWHVSGCDYDNGDLMVGVLEWCVNKKDALEMLKAMKSFSQFSNLSIAIWR